jgi:hypothetical protein
VTSRRTDSHGAAKAAKRGRAAERLAFNEQLQSGVDHAALATAVGRRLAMAPRAFPAAALDEWVPIGPTVTRRGQAMSRPRVSGRVRDIAVSPDGQRAYASSAKGGLWYTDDAGATWAPVGGWAGRSVNPLGNGNMFSGGALLVDFGAPGFAGTDVVLLGTGEPIPFQSETNSSAQGGVGVLAALGPAFDPVQSDPWEPDTGIALLGGLGIWRLARQPGARALSSAGADQDRVLAATTNGLYLGTRSHLPAVVAAPPPAPMQPPVVALPAREGYTWAACAAAAPTVPPNARRDVTDVLWLVNGAGSRIVYAIRQGGVFFSDNNGGAATAIAALQAPAIAFANRISLALVPGTSRVYVLAEVTVAGVPTPSVWQITDVLAAPQGVVPVPGVPRFLFGDPARPTQGWYDHGIAVEAVGGNDRLYLGGSTVKPRTDAEGQWSASLWCLETPSPPAAVAALTPPATISLHGNPPAGSGADQDGLIGNNVHADVHAIRLTANSVAPNRHVWVGCDGGVYVSEHSGRVNTFAARNTGLATLEPVFLGAHPTSSHFQSAGFQDNGTQVRVGDTVWEEIFVGDGGGTAFHPIRSDILIAQYTRGTWNGTPASDYLDPLTRQPGKAAGTGREGGRSAFYSGAATIADSANTGRVALGTNRVWVTDNLGGGAATLRWRALPYPNGTETDTRPNGTDAQQAFGVPPFVNANFVDNAGISTADQVIDLVWQSNTDLLVVHRGAIVRYTNTNKAAGTWNTTTWLLGAGGAIPFALNTTLTSVATVPGGLDFYVGTLGDQTNPAIETVWFFDNALGTFTATRLRRQLDFPGPPVVAGPRDPCFALVVDPTNAAVVYAGTATGVWRGTRTAPATWNWVPYMNGLPQATVQDLEVWQDPTGAAASPRLLRAAMQSRGVWEADLARGSTRRTYLRVHPRDDRRMLPTPMANPRRRPTATAEPVYASPDIVVRPAWPQAAPPAFHSAIQIGNLPVYDIWTFQTAFRWLYPSCVADGQWSDAMRDLVRFHRQVLALSPGAIIDQTLWRHVVGGVVGGVQRGVRLLPDPVFSEKATVTSNVADALAVYRAPWQTTLNFAGAATEIDLLETVLPVRSSGDEWTVFREPSTVDILLHHRDSRIVQPPAAFAMLLWRAAPTSAALVSAAPAGLKTFFDGVVAAGVGGVAPATPAGWNVAAQPGGRVMWTLTKPLDARLPRSIPIDVDLTGVPEGQRVMLLAMVGSTADDPVTAPVNIPPGNNPPANVGEFVRAWPNAAIRIVRVTRRI